MAYLIPSYRVKLVRDRATIRVSGPTEASEALRKLCCSNAAVESMHVLYLDGRNNIVGSELVAMGGACKLGVSVPEILRGAIVAGANSIILGHNHPSGSPEPSQDDIKMTKAVAEACTSCGLSLVDHIIVTAYNGCTSMLDRGML